jgi:hypothetical protein
MWLKLNHKKFSISKVIQFNLNNFEVAIFFYLALTTLESKQGFTVCSDEFAHGLIFY